VLPSSERERSLKRRAEPSVGVWRSSTVEQAAYDAASLGPPFREVAYRLHLYWQPPLAVEAPLLRSHHLGWLSIDLAVAWDLRRTGAVPPTPGAADDISRLRSPDAPFGLCRSLADQLVCVRGRSLTLSV